MTDRYVTLSGAPTRNPGPIFDSAQAAGLPTDFFRCANSIRCPLGTLPGSAWLIVDATVAAALTPAGQQQITWYTESGLTIFQKYYLHSAKAVGADGDGKTAYLVELRDKRAILALSSINKRYNTNKPTPHYIADGGSTTDKYYADSLNGSALRTWAQIWTDIWAQLPSTIRGTAPTLPYTPAQTPKNLVYCGMSTMMAVSQFLACIGCALKLDPIADVLTVVRLGGTQSGLSAAIAAQAQNRMFDNKGKNFVSTTMPATIRVCFPAQRGQNDDHTEPAYTVDEATGITDAIAGTVMVLWDTMPALYANDDTSPSNTTELNARAAEIAANLTLKLTADVVNGYLKLRGLVKTILPGEQVSGVWWRDYSDGDGLVTEVYQDVVIPPYPQRSNFNMRKIARFKLTADLTGSSAAAVFVDSGGSDTTDTLTVFDPFSIFTGTASGQKGYAAFMEDSQHWEILQLLCG